MTPSEDLKDASTHFAFGDNWADYARGIDEARLASAEAGIGRLLDGLALDGVRFLDIGCGSGLHALAALRLGAGRVLAVDLDMASVETARALLGERAPADRHWEVHEVSVFDLAPESTGRFDVVYSWGVLHHTGAMWEAVARAAALVAPGGYLAIALYRKTPLCGFWRAEKRFYAGAEPWLQSLLRGLYKAAFVAGLMATGRSPWRYVREYAADRGMSWSHDVYDWLGGYPYESAAPEEVTAALKGLGFACARHRPTSPPLGGLFGSACDEYLFRRLPEPEDRERR